LHRKVGRFLAFEDAIDVAGRATVLIDQIRPVRDQTATGDVKAIGIDRGQSMPGRKLDNQIAMNDRLAAGHDQTATRGIRKGRDGALNLGRITHIDWDDFHAERRRHSLDDGELPDPGRCTGISNDSRSRHAGRDLLEQFQPLAAQAVFELHKARGIATRPG